MTSLRLWSGLISRLRCKTCFLQRSRRHQHGFEGIVSPTFMGTNITKQKQTNWLVLYLTHYFSKMYKDFLFISAHDSSWRSSCLNRNCTSGVWDSVMLADRYLLLLLLTDRQTHGDTFSMLYDCRKCQNLVSCVHDLSQHKDLHSLASCPEGLPEVVCEENWKTGRKVRCKDGSRVCLTSTCLVGWSMRL